MTDATLLVGILTCQLCLYAIWRGDRRHLVFLLLGIALGFSTLVKGPIALFYMGATLVLLGIFRLLIPNRSSERRDSLAPASSQSTGPIEQQPTRWKQIAIRAALVLVPVAVIVLPWLIAIELRIPGYTFGTIGSELVERGKQAQEGHTGPPGFYLALIWGTYFPWSLLLPAAIWQGWKRRRVPWVRFSLAAVIGAWVPLEIYQTKLPHYLLPAYPFLAILTADAIVRSLRGRIPDLSDKLFRITSLVVGGLVVLLIPALLYGPILWTGGEPVRTHVTAIALSALLMAVTALVTRRLHRGELSRAVTGMALGTALAFVVIWSLHAPALRSVALNQRVAAHVAGEPSVKMVEYKEASLAFYQGGSIREESDADFLQTTDPSRWPAMLVITADAWQRQPATIRAGWAEVARERGITLAEPNQLLEVLVLRRHEQPLARSEQTLERPEQTLAGPEQTLAGPEQTPATGPTTLPTP